MGEKYLKRQGENTDARKDKNGTITTNHTKGTNKQGYSPLRHKNTKKSY
jgi:hypothetical protein